MMRRIRCLFRGRRYYQVANLLALHDPRFKRATLPNGYAEPLCDR